MTKEQQAALDLLYNTYSPLGYDIASIAGIAGNGLVESGLNPDSVSASKTYHGAWLNHKNIRKAIEGMYGDYSMNSLMKFIDDWNNRADKIMKGNYSAYTSTNAGKYKKGGYKTARDAADAFMRYYERPVIMKDGKVVGYQKANERYANAEAAYKYLYDKYGSPEITEYNLPDGGKRMIFKPRQVDVQQPDAVAVSKPTAITPVKRELPIALVLRTLPETVITGRRIQPLSSLFSAELPSLDDVFDLGGPENLFKQYVADALGVPNMHLKMPSFKKGKPGEDELIDGGVPFSITVTGKDRRPAWRRMYENPHLASTDQYYNRDAAKNITEWAPGIGDVLQGFDAYDAAKNGNYTEAAMLGGLLLLPNVIEGPLKAGGKVVKKAIDYRMPGGENIVDKMRKYAAKRELEGTLDDIQMSTGDIAKDPYIGRMGIAEGKKYTKYPSVVVLNLENSIYSRMKAMRPWLKPEEFAKQFFNLADGKWTSHPAETFKYAYGDGSNVIGQFSPNTGNIAVRAGSDVESVLLHEIRHKLDDGMPLTEEEENILRAAYGDKFLEIPKVDPTWEQTGLSRDYNIWDEAVTTNRDARDKALGKVKAREWPVELLNKIIDKLSDQLILEAIAGANGYGRSFVDNLIGDGPLDARLVPKEQIKAWREAMKKVGMFSAAGYFGTRFLQPRQNSTGN